MSFGAKKEVNGVIVPVSLPDAIGLGCPMCDDAFIVPMATRQEELSAITTAFLKKHDACGNLESLERRGSTTQITGTLQKHVVFARS